MPSIKVADQQRPSTSSQAFWPAVGTLGKHWTFTPLQNHRITYPKGVHSFRYCKSTIFRVRFNFANFAILTNSRKLKLQLDLNAHTHSEFAMRKYLNGCMPFGYVSLWNTPKWYLIMTILCSRSDVQPGELGQTHKKCQAAISGWACISVFLSAHTEFNNKDNFIKERFSEFLEDTVSLKIHSYLKNNFIAEGYHIIASCLLLDYVHLKWTTELFIENAGTQWTDSAVHL